MIIKGPALFQKSTSQWFVTMRIIVIICTENSRNEKMCFCRCSSGATNEHVSNPSAATRSMFHISHPPTSDWLMWPLTISATYDPSAFLKRLRRRWQQSCCSLTLNSFNGREEISKLLSLVCWAQSGVWVDQIVQLQFVPLPQRQLLAEALQCQSSGSRLRLRRDGHFISNTFSYCVSHCMSWC